MKINYLFPALLLVLLPTASSLYGMKAASEPSQKPKTVSIVNNTKDKLDIAYTLSHEPPTQLTLEHGEKIMLPGDLSSLKELYVNPYGQVKGWFSATTLTRGYMKGTNVAELPDVKKAQQENMSILISIKPGGKAVEATVGEGYLSSIAAAVSPYSFEVYGISKPGTTGHPLLITVFLFEQFPQVLKALELKKPILPRYVLSIPESADAQAIEAAYKRIRTQWEPKTRSSFEGEKKLALKVIEFAEEAKKSLLNESNIFDKLADQNSFYLVPEEESEVLPLEFALAEKGSEAFFKNMTPEQREAMEEEGWSFN